MTAKCPSCQKAANKSFAPFCSERCKDVDLGKWLTGSYAIAGRDGEANIPDQEFDEGY